MPDDAQLLRRYVQENSEDAFRELAQRYLDLVYSAALRQLGGDVHRAQDVAQVVFATLARKAASLTNHPALVGWLYNATHRAAASMARAEARRYAREQKAFVVNEVLSSNDETIDWQRVRPVLDEAMRQLGDSDREAILLRYFGRRPFAEIGAALQLSEDAARMRVERALEKLHVQLLRRGITSTVSALAAVLTCEAVASAPAGLLATVSGYAVATANATGGAAIASWISMSITKTTISVVAVAAIGLTAYQMSKVHRADAMIATLTRERDSLAKRIEAEPKQVNARVAALSNQGTKPAAVPFSPPAWPGFPRLEKLLRDPAYRKLQVITARGQLDGRYAPLFKALSLPPEQLDQFKNLLVEKQMAATDAVWAAHDQGISPFTNHEELVQAIQDAVGSVDGQIKTMLGDDVYGQFQQYEQTQPERNVVNQLEKSLSYTQTPLTGDQANQLIQALQQAAPTTSAQKPSIATNGLTGITIVGSPAYTVTDQAISLAQTVLSPNQVAALQQIQLQQQAQKQMNLLSGNRSTVTPSN